MENERIENENVLWSMAHSHSYQKKRSDLGGGCFVTHIDLAPLYPDGSSCTAV